MDNDNTKVKQLLDKCKDLTEDHIIKACEKYHDELIKQNKGESHYIVYNDEYYQLNPTMRYANNEFLNNKYKLLANKNEKTEEEKKRIFTSYQYRDFFEQKFSQSSRLKIIVKNNNKMPFWWEIYAFVLYLEKKPLSIEELKGHKIVEEMCPLKETTISKLSTTTDLTEYSNKANPVYKGKRRKDIIIFENDENSDRWELNDVGLKYVELEVIPKYSIFANYLEIEGDKNMTGKQPLNQILYGPPGTGKTYNTVVKAMEIIGYEYLFRKWFDEKSVAKDKDKVCKAYLSAISTIKENIGIDIFSYSVLEDYQKIRKYIEGTQYFNENCLHAPSSPGNSYYQQALIHYETFLNEISYEKLKDGFNYYKSANSQIEFITFHQSYSYEEFIEGIKPCATSGKVKFEYKNGIFKEICIKANSDPDNNYVVIIDEINRGNISKIFGELITLIEEDKRIKPNGENEEDDKDMIITSKSLEPENALTASLPYTNQEFGVPSNLYIIGTMNTADKSLALLDVALRRRFEFIPRYPQADLIDDKYADYENKRKFLESINEIILEDKKSPDYLIGHAYFMNNDSLVEVLNKKVIPLLMEYYNGKQDKVEEILNKVFVQNYETVKENYYLQVK